MLNEFIIVSKPCFEYFNASESQDRSYLYLQGNEKLKQLYGQSLEDSEVTFIHPIDDNQAIFSFGLAQNIDPYEFLVKNDDFKSFFKQDLKTMVYFNEDLKYDNLHIPDEYQLSRLQKRSLNSSISDFAFKYSHFSTHFYENNPNNIPDESKECKLEGDNNTDSLHEYGWVNPIIIKINLNHNTLGKIKAIKEIDCTVGTVENTLSCLLDPSCLLYLEPVFSDENSIQIEFLEMLSEQLQCKMSLVDSILWCQNLQKYKNWKPFVSLDCLKGTFRIEGHGEKNLQKFWSPPHFKKVSDNLLWYANYWLELWSGKLVELPKENDFFVFSSENEQQTNVGQYSYNLPVEQHKSKINEFSLLDIFQLYEKSYNKSKSSIKPMLIMQTEEILFNNLKKLIKEFKHRSEILKSHKPFVWVLKDKDSSKYSIQFNDIAFLDYFSKEYIAPKSPILIKLPDVLKSDEQSHQLYVDRIKHYYIDLIRSPKWGGALFLLKLSKFLERGIYLDKIFLCYKRGWWVEWYDSLFSCEKKIMIHMFSDYKSRLGQYKLSDHSKNNYQQDRFFGF